MRIVRIADISDSVPSEWTVRDAYGDLDLLDASMLIDRVASDVPLEQVCASVAGAVGIEGVRVLLRDTEPESDGDPEPGAVKGDRHCLIRSSSGAVLGYLVLPQRVGSPSVAQRRRIRSVCQLLAIAIERQRLLHPVDLLRMPDELTGLPHRRELNPAIRDAVNATRETDPRAPQSVAVMMLDIDGFALINDAHGHDAGDALLREAADRMRRTLRGNDSIFRISGDQFVLVCTKIKRPRDAKVVAERLMEVLGEPFEMVGDRPGVRHRVSAVTASIGMTLTNGHGVKASQLRREAGVALRRAKANGRNTFAIYDAATGAAALDQLQLESELRTAFGSTWTAFQSGDTKEAAPFGRFELHWQPQVNGDGVTVGFEALARWPHPKRKMVPPVQFIPAAEKCGQIVAFGRWALQMACRQGAAWYRQGLRGPDGQPLRVAVNVSALEFARDDLLDHVCRSLEEADLPASGLELELTESVLMHDTAAAVDKLHGLQEAGVRIAIDDFGTGYSSLAYLHQMPLNTLKIDRTFVMEVDDKLELRPECSRSKTAVLRSVCSLGHTLGLELVAEGVETAYQRQFCTDLGAHLLQGYYFGRPMPASEVADYLAQGATMKLAA